MAHFSSLIALIVLLSAPVWFAVGWWFASIGRSKQHRARETEWNHNLNRLRRERDTLRSQINLAHDKIHSLENQQVQTEESLQTSADDSKSKQLSTRLQAALEQAKQQISGFAQKVNTLHEQSIEREDVLEQLKKKLTETSRTLHEREQSLEQLRNQDSQGLVATTPQAANDNPTSNDPNHQNLLALRHSVDDLTRENHEQQKKIDQLSQGSKVVEHQRSRLQTLQNDYDEQQRVVKQLTQSVTDNEPKLIRLTELEAKYVAMQSKFDELTHQIQQAQQNHVSREHNNKVLPSQEEPPHHDETMTHLRLNELNDVVEQHELTISKLREQAALREQQYDDELLELHETMDAQERVVSQLREALAKPTQASSTQPSQTSAISNQANSNQATHKPNQSTIVPTQSISHTPQSGNLFASEEAATVTTPRVKRYDEAPERYDNLKKINGIGPAFERSLNALGLYEFEQIAALSQADIEWVAQSLRSFPDRIVKGQWVEQAQKLIARRDG